VLEYVLLFKIRPVMEKVMDKANPKVIVEYIGDAVVATLADEKILEETDIQQLEQTLMPLVEQDGAVNIVIDFSNVKFLSSSVLGLLIRVSKKVYENGGQMRLCNIDPKILKIFKITRLDRVFEIHKELASALESFK